MKIQLGPTQVARRIGTHLISSLFIILRYPFAHELVHGLHHLGELSSANATVAVEVVQLERPLESLIHRAPQQRRERYDVIAKAYCTVAVHVERLEHVMSVKARIYDSKQR